MKLIVIGGAKNSHKDLLAMKFASNSDCIWIKPYSDQPVPVNGEPVEDMFIPLNKQGMENKLITEVVLAETAINGNRYVFFKHQLNADYVVLTGDDRIISYLKDNWDGDLILIKCHSDNEEQSKISTLDDNEFDFVFQYGVDDYDTLEALVI